MPPKAETAEKNTANRKNGYPFASENSNVHSASSTEPTASARLNPNRGKHIVHGRKKFYDANRVPTYYGRRSVGGRKKNSEGLRCELSAALCWSGGEANFGTLVVSPLPPNWVVTMTMEKWKEKEIRRRGVEFKLWCTVYGVNNAFCCKKHR